MAKIQVSASVPEKRELESIDPTGETWVIVKPPTWQEEKRRGRMLSKRKDYFDENGLPATEIDVNTRELTEAELWLTYVDTNLEVDLMDGDEVVETITFEPKEKTSVNDFLTKLNKLPGSIVYAWREAVVSVVPDWRYPF